MSHRAPAKRTQWTLFLMSVALFMAVGALMWGPMFALGILVVVLIHELGHFLAMRAFGYRNVHMLALPLVGGVAMGVNANPAATRAAWMSLMGPLPGIVIGWVLLLVWALGLLPADVAEPAFSLALLFLLVNYLNVLPVPPLDGAHVVQALLPARFARLQTLFLASAALIGAFVAWQFGFLLLTLLALLQLTGVPMLWRLHGAERDLAADVNLAGAHRNVRLLGVARKLERELGPAINAQQRVKQTSDVLMRLETKPMGTMARLATGSVYAALLVVPLTALLLFQLPTLLTGTGVAQAEARWEQEQQAERALRASAKDLPLAELLHHLSAETSLAAPASAESVAEVEARLGKPLPAELREIYAVSDGVPATGLHPVSRVSQAVEVIDAQLAEYSDAMHIGFQQGDDYRYVEVPLADASNWWHLGGDEDAPLFYLPAPDPRLPGKRVISYFLESPSAYGSLREWLEESWVSEQLSQAAMVEHTRRSQAAFERLRAASLAELIATFEQTSLMVRLLADLPEWPEGATAEQLTEHGRRLQLELPHDYAEFLQLHDGFPPLNLLSVTELAPWRDRATQIDPALREALFAVQEMPELPTHTGEPAKDLNEAAVERCLIAAAMQDNAATTFWPSLVWCPHATAESRWIDLSLRRRYPDFRAWLLDRSVPNASSKEALEEGSLGA